MILDSRCNIPNCTGTTPLSLWAKTGNIHGEAAYHPLLCHMLDVAAVFELIWDYHLTQFVRNRLEKILGEGKTRERVAFWAGAHDIGKASPGFQHKRRDLCQKLNLRFSENDIAQPHGRISAYVLREYFGQSPASSLCGQIAGGHHGSFPRAEELCGLSTGALGNAGWTHARQALLKEFSGIMGVHSQEFFSPEQEIRDPYTVPVLAGIIAVADWIASNQDYFPCLVECGKEMGQAPRDYWEESQQRAENALECLGWLPEVAFGAESSFEEVFPGLSPNSLQGAVHDLAAGKTSPYLMIVEAPMGQGKTEAALYAADMALCRGFARGMYVAMPTQATGNAMFKRVLDDYLRKRGHAGKLNLQLVHGDALLAKPAETREGEIPSFEPRCSENGDEADVEAQSWFTAKKRPLLSPFGVGTIDQSLLSVLQTKHWFVRLFGLAGKVVIFDEVHAYDAYMSAILERLLQWLAELDCTVILLSATLPEAKRKAFVEAYSGGGQVEYRPYPRITAALPKHFIEKQTESQSHCVEISSNGSSVLQLAFATPEPGELNETLRDNLANGGCAAVVCNTVNRGIEVFRHLRDHLPDAELLLFHARTLQMWRRQREEEVLRKFGKGNSSERPFRAVLVATQVIEQSLDLDFDFMVSEMAPIDLLLQRSGRLHRHARPRPKGLESPRLLILCDATREGPPPESFGKAIEYVYARHTLLKTWQAVRGKETISLPGEMEPLVEAVYGPGDSAAESEWLEALAAARKEMESQRVESEKAANKLLIKRPMDPSEIVEQYNDRLADDDDPEIHKTVRAATRQGDPSITVVMLSESATLAEDPGIAEVRELLERSVKIGHSGLFRAFLEEGELPAAWRRNAHLKHARLLRLDEAGRGRIGGYVITVDETLGVTFEREE